LPLVTEDSSMMKKFASFLKEFVNLNRQREIEKKAEQITDKMIESGLISAEEVLSKLSELKDMSMEDLTIQDKALDLHKQGEFLSIGALSEMPGDGALSARDKFVSDLQD
jgi:hypothetical protein